jgi:hypothetical protein
VTTLSMVRGDSAEFDVHLTEPDGTDLDLTGLDITFTVKENRHLLDADALFVKTVGDGITNVSATGGITVEPDDTADLEHLPSYRWDVQVQSGTDVRTPLSGRLVISPDVTRTTT